MQKNQRYWCHKEGDTKIKVKDVNGVLLQQVCSCFRYLGSELMAEGGVNAVVKQSTDSLEQTERNNKSDL